MRVICIECGALGRINKTNRLSDNVAHLYCQCTDAECGYRWVSTLAYSRPLNPSRRSVGDAVLAVLGLSSEQRAILASTLNEQLAGEQKTDLNDKNKPIYQRR
ncbi:ogr/Delta-like zinc finger family protein [Aeromonas bivalvium]|uniref:ogr/Delta-like zinc finger family protein n=1 Tax=Aeromonas bivalvium TaxID=440079 RepID=UPI0038D189FB